MTTRPAPAITCSAAACLLLSGCVSPLSDDRTPGDWDAFLSRAIDAELRTAPAEGTLILERPAEQPAISELAPRRERLDQLTPALEGERPELVLGPDLYGQDQQEIVVGRDDLVLSAVGNNLGIQIARLQPTIGEQDVIAEAAAFDPTLFGQVDWAKTDEPRAAPVVGGIPVGTPFNNNERLALETGLRQTLLTGGEVTVSTDLTRFDDDTPGFSLVPDPGYTAAVRIGASQPLLRGAGVDVNRAGIDFAQNAVDRTVERLRSDLLATVDEVLRAYWDLGLAWYELEIRQWLLAEGVGVRDMLELRRRHDAIPAQYSDAVATVEARRAALVRARRGVRGASDRLKVLVNDPALTIGSEVVLRPLDDVTEEPIDVDLRTAVVTAIEYRPEVRQSLLDIDDADIRRLLAENSRKPLLNLTAEVAYVGLDGDGGDAYDRVADRDFIDYVLGLLFEYPIGNRAGDAGIVRARLERSTAVLAYEQAVQSIMLEVKSALRDVITNYDLIFATRTSRIAAAESLRALLVEEANTAGMTPEFLNLKFTRQESLAISRLREIESVVDYDKAIVALYRSTGTALQKIGVEVAATDPEDVE